MAYPHEAQFSFRYPTEHLAQIVFASLSQEKGEIDDDRSHAHLNKHGEELELTIAAADLVAFRAGINTWLSLVSVADRVTESGDF